MQRYVQLLIVVCIGNQPVYRSSDFLLTDRGKAYVICVWDNFVSWSASLLALIVLVRPLTVCRITVPVVFYFTSATHHAIHKCSTGSFVPPKKGIGQRGVFGIPRFQLIQVHTQFVRWADAACRYW
jgi:hypothetical protein